jgi:TolA-binding protein
MKRRSLAGLSIVALGLARLPLDAQVPQRQPFFPDDRPVPRAVPVTPRGVVPPPTQIPRAIPITPRPAGTPAPAPAPEAAPAPATPKPMAPPEPADPGEIRVSPNAAPKSADQVQMELADSYYARKMYAEAAPEYERYIGLYQNGADRPAALFRLGESYRIRGSNNAAKNAYETLLSQFANGDFIGPAAYRLAEIYYQEKQYRDALTLYRKASVRLKEPAVVNAAKFFSGRCLEVLGQRLEARTVYEDLVGTTKDNPFHDASRLSFALLLKEGGRLPEALKQIQLLAKDTENPELKLEATTRSGIWSLELDPPQTARAESDFKAAMAMPGKPYWKELAQLGQVRIQSDAGKYPQVLEAYEKLGAQLSPDVKPEMLMLAANAQRQLGKLSDSLVTYEQVTKEFPGSVYDKEAQYERLRSMYQTTDEKLVDEIDKYLLANPEAQKRDEVLLMKAEVLFKKEDYAGAIPIYSSLELSRTLTPNRKAEALFRLGWCQIQTQNLEGAIKVFTSFINGFPTHKLLPFALLQRGLANQSLKNLTAALKDYEALIKNHPKSPQREMALQQQALIQGQQGNYAAMSESFKQLLKEFPETPAKVQASYWIGWSAFENKNYKEAAPHLKEARDLEAAKKGEEADKEQFGEKAAIRVLLSQYYLEDTTETSKEVDRYSKEGKTKVPPEILRWLGRKFYDAASHASAEKYLAMLTERDDAMPDDFLLLGLSQLAQGRYKESTATFQKYLQGTKLPVPRANGLLSLAEAQTGLGAFDDAQKTVDEALALQPEGEINGRARIAAGNILMARKRHEEAAKLYESVAVMLDDPEITPQALELAVKAWRAAGKDDEAEKTLNKLKSRYPEYWQRKSATAKP